MSGSYPGDPQSSQWPRREVDPSLPLNQQKSSADHPAPPGQGDRFAISSLILGIVSVSLGWIPICGIVALAPAIIGIVLGGLGLKSLRHRTLAIAGIVLSVIGLVLSMLIYL
jgi:hypothetical protein